MKGGQGTEAARHCASRGSRDGTSGGKGCPRLGPPAALLERGVGTQRFLVVYSARLGCSRIGERARGRRPACRCRFSPRHGWRRLEVEIKSYAAFISAEKRVP